MVAKIKNERYRNFPTRLSIQPGILFQFFPFIFSGFLFSIFSFFLSLDSLDVRELLFVCAFWCVYHMNGYVWQSFRSVLRTCDICEKLRNSFEISLFASNKAKRIKRTKQIQNKKKEECQPNTRAKKMEFVKIFFNVFVYFIENKICVQQLCHIESKYVGS